MPVDNKMAKLLILLHIDNKERTVFYYSTITLYEKIAPLSEMYF